MNRELNVVLMPDGSLQLEWNEIENPLSKTVLLFQNEIFRRFNVDPDDSGTW
jgi:non-specific serine/threonine protein kinase